jgi:hypothetical protein
MKNSLNFVNTCPRVVDTRRFRSSHTVVCFGGFELERYSGELRKDGTRIRLQEQPLQILNAAFAARPPSILADSITTPICVRETTKLSRANSLRRFGHRNRWIRPELRVPTLDDEVHANSRHATDNRSLSGIADLLRPPL